MPCGITSSPTKYANRIFYTWLKAGSAGWARWAMAHPIILALKIF